MPAGCSGPRGCLAVPEAASVRGEGRGAASRGGEGEAREAAQRPVVQGSAPQQGILPGRAWCRGPETILGEVSMDSIDRSCASPSPPPDKGSAVGCRQGLDLLPAESAGLPGRLGASRAGP